MDLQESFVGTGAVAVTPTALGLPSPRRTKKKRGDDQDTTSRLESDMSDRRTISEWQPPFKGAGYDPGDYQMPEPAGKGVADRSPTQDNVGQYDTELTGAGKEWPRDHNDTAAMCDVDEDGVEHESQGGHESTHGEPNDGIQKKIGHNWPNQPKNSGQGVAEPFGGSRWSDGGTLEGHGPGGDTWTHEEGPGMPGEGEITGTSGPQLGQPTTEGRWSPEAMAHCMGEDFDIQNLFDAYARNATAVCLEDFQQLCDAHGVDTILDEASIMRLMHDNQEFVFYEGRDGDGPYWTPESISEANLAECSDSCGEGDYRRPFKGKKKVKKEGRGRNGQTIEEMQVRPPEVEAGLYGGKGGSPLHSDLVPLGDPDMPPSPEMGGTEDALGMNLDYDPMLAAHHEHQSRHGPGPYGGDRECPGCGYVGAEEECPECGVETMDPMAGSRGSTELFMAIPRG
jgi:hypothetical protein